MTATGHPMPGATAGVLSRGDRPHRVLTAAWPLIVAVAGFPVWWAIGLTPLVFPLVAIPMAWQLSRRREVRVPPGFWIWLLFLVWVLASGLALNLTAPATLPPSGTGRFIAYGIRFANYAALTVLVLYIGNLPERVLPRSRVIRTLGVLCLWTMALGCAALVFPHVEFQSPAAALLPDSVADARGDATIALAQVQSVLGDSTPRPAAPFTYTNAWGNSLSLLLVWFVVGWWVMGDGRRRLVAGIALVVVSVPIVYSLNRGMWIGLLLSVVYVAVRLAARGRVLTLIAVVAALGIGGVAFAASPLSRIVDERLDTGHSNATRQSLAGESIRTALSSPLIGYGSTRRTLGNQKSIAIGASEDCPKCGNRGIGSTGQIWLLLVAQGFIGAGLYVGYFLWTAWTYRHDHSAIGIAGTLVVLLSLFYGFFYTALTMPLAVTFISIGLLWRNSLIRQGTEPAGRRPVPVAP